MELLSAPKTSTYKDQALKVLSVIGGIVVVAGIAWVGVRGLSLFPNVGTFVANALAGLQSVFVPAERIEIGTVDSQIVVNEPFTLSWEHRNRDLDGSYEFSYECRDNIFLARRTNGMQTTLFCNTDVPLSGSEREMSLVVVGAVSGAQELPVTIAFTPTDESTPTVTGEAMLLVQEERFDTATSTDATPSQTNPVPATPSAPRQFTTVPVVSGPISDPNGDPDLLVRVLSYGIVDKKTGVFVALGEIPQDLPTGKRAAVRFEIENIGTKETGEWRFEAELPTSPSYTYESKDQQSLFPGDKIEYTIGFDRVRNAAEDEFSITADSDDDVDESNERNNTVTRTIDIDQ